MPKTIKKIMSEFDKRFVLQSPGGFIGLGEISEPQEKLIEQNPAQYRHFIESSLLLLLDEVEKRLPSDTISDRGFNECLEICNNILSSLRDEE